MSFAFNQSSLLSRPTSHAALRDKNVKVSKWAFLEGPSLVAKKPKYDAFVIWAHYVNLVKKHTSETTPFAD